MVPLRRDRPPYFVLPAFTLLALFIVGPTLTDLFSAA